MRTKQFEKNWVLRINTETEAADEPSYEPKNRFPKGKYEFEDTLYFASREAAEEYAGQHQEALARHRERKSSLAP